jgi:long-subunit acyl-CoA synthetase (AMP-forming)
MDNEMMTPTLKLRKSIILDRFKDPIDAMYR